MCASVSRVEYWYHFSSVLPTSLLHSFALHFIVFLPIPLCLLFWSLLIAEMLILHTAPGHPPARKVCVTCLEDYCGGVSRRELWRKPKGHTKWPLSFYPTQLAAISPFSDYIVRERIHHHTFTPLPPPPLLPLTGGEKKLRWFDSALQREGRRQRKLLVGSSLTVICDSVVRCGRRKKKEGWDKRRGNLRSEYIKSWSTLMKVVRSYEIHNNEQLGSCSSLFCLS